MSGFTSLWQRIYFNIFTFNKFTQINIVGLPVLLFLRNKHIKKAYQKRGVADPEKTVRRVLVDRKNSTIVWLTDGFMCILIMIIFFTIVNLLSAAVGTMLMANLNKIVFVAVCLILTMGFNYIVLWKNDKYVDYFEKFEKEPKVKKRKWAWISFGVVVGIFLLMILSFAIMTKELHKVSTPEF